MIDKTRLGGIKKIIAHGRETGPCADGLAAALIVRNVLLDVAVRFLQYESVELATLPAEPGLLFLDITPSPARAAEFLKAGSFVLDHHASMESVTRQFAEAGQGAYASPDQRGVSAATLAYREVWEPLIESEYEGISDRMIDSRRSDVSYFAELAGIYDTWKKDDFRWPIACELTAALYFFPAEEWLADKDLSFSRGASLERRAAFGAALVRERGTRADYLVAGAERYVTEKGTRVAVCASSEISEAAERMTDVDVVVGFTFRVRDGKPAMKVSFRSRGSYEARPIAESLGGGGHDRAASAWVDLDDVNANPYVWIRTLMTKW